MIEFKGVHLTYDSGTKALLDINFRILDGEFVFLVGPSGAGKSSIIKLIMRELVHTSGEVTVNGYNIKRMKKKNIPHLRRTMGIVFQDFRLIPHMTVYENVAFAMRVTGASSGNIRKRVPYILDLVGLSHKARSLPSQISGGEQQRVGLARALVNNPSMIIADEPTGNIDAQLATDIVDLFDEINRRGTTVVMVTHDNKLVERCSHRVIELKNGCVASDTGGDFI